MLFERYFLAGLLLFTFCLVAGFSKETASEQQENSKESARNE
jgi:hypothetical protein